jgi:GTP-binding protein EngB required for normal cell division
MPESERTSILAALSQLDTLAADADRDTLHALRDRLQSARLRVLVAGEAKRGKSTLINALLGRDVLPTGVTPLTAVATTVTAGRPEAIEVSFGGGRVEDFPLVALADFGTERGNPAGRRNVASITVRLDAPLLRRGVEIVDTPGTGSVHAHNTATADLALPSMDAAIFVLTADPPVSSSERELLGRVAGLSVALFIVLNKADYLDSAGLAEAVEFTEQVAVAATGRPVRIYPVSARAGLTAAGDTGFAAFAADFLGYLDSGRVSDVELSVAGHARRIAEQLLDEVALAQRAARLPGEEAAARVAAFGARLAAVSEQCAAAEDQAAGRSRRMLTALNSAAAEAERRLAAEIGSAVGLLLDSELAAASPAEIERLGRSRLTGLVTQAVDTWRREQAALLDAGLRGIDEQCTAGLAAELAEVRAAAAELLGLGLVLPPAASALGSDRQFFYVLDERVDQAELLAGAVRRRLPGEVGRRLARQHVLGEVPELVGAHVGRARGDLQYRLAEATRRLLADVRQRYTGSTERLAAALQRAATIRADAAGQADRELAGLAAREEALHAVITVLPPGPAARGDLSSTRTRRR